VSHVGKTESGSPYLSKLFLYLSLTDCKRTSTLQSIKIVT